MLCLSTEYCEERARPQLVDVAIRKLADVWESCVAVWRSSWATCISSALGVVTLLPRGGAALVIEPHRRLYGISLYNVASCLTRVHQFDDNRRYSLRLLRDQPI